MGITGTWLRACGDEENRQEKKDGDEEDRIAHLSHERLKQVQIFSPSFSPTIFSTSTSFQTIDL
ncbi:MAG TPA: hypothetical protein PLM24_04505, partial [Methanothrix sp.]|nr:hypothetical protein [Methanothrix sp.]